MYRVENEGAVLRGQISGIDSPTTFDLSSIGDLSDVEILQKVESLLKSSLDDSSTFLKINRIYKKVLVYMTKELFYSSRELSRFSNIDFGSKEDIIVFLKETSRPRGVLNCVIAKLFQAFNDADEEFNEKVKFVKDKTSQVIDAKLIPRLQIRKNDGDKLVGEIFIEVEKGNFRKAPFTIKKRVKSTNSSISKEVRDPKYFTADAISDWFGATVEVEKKEDILPLMQMIAAYVFKRGTYEVKNDKGMFSTNEIIDNTEIGDTFKDLILKGTVSRNKPESGNMEDIKLITPITKGDEINNMSLEIKFIVKESPNEKGLNMHGVYNYMKKISERIRLEGCISPEYIELVAQKFMENLSDLLYENTGRKEEDGDSIESYKSELFRDLRLKSFIVSTLSLKNNHTKANIDSHIITGLIAFFKSKLIPVKKLNTKKTFYTNKRGLQMSQGNKIGAEFIDLRD